MAHSLLPVKLSAFAMKTRLAVMAVAFAVSFPFILPSCSDEEDVPDYSGGEKTAGAVQNDLSSLVLARRVKRTIYNAGMKDQKLELRLINKAVTPVFVDGWKKNEKDDVVVEYAFCVRGEAGKIKESDWKRAYDPVMEAPKQNQLILNPGMSVFIDAPLDFLAKVKVPRGKNAIAFRAKLNVPGTDVRSPVYEATLRQPTVDVVIE